MTSKNPKLGTTASKSYSAAVHDQSKITSPTPYIVKILMMGASVVKEGSQILTFSAKSCGPHHVDYVNVFNSGKGDYATSIISFIDHFFKQKYPFLEKETIVNLTVPKENGAIIDPKQYYSASVFGKSVKTNTFVFCVEKKSSIKGTTTFQIGISAIKRNAPKCNIFQELSTVRPTDKPAIVVPKKNADTSFYLQNLSLMKDIFNQLQVDNPINIIQLDRLLANLINSPIDSLSFIIKGGVKGVYISESTVSLYEKLKENYLKHYKFDSDTYEKYMYQSKEVSMYNDKVRVAVFLLKQVLDNAKGMKDLLVSPSDSLIKTTDKNSIGLQIMDIRDVILYISGEYDPTFGELVVSPENLKQLILSTSVESGSKYPMDYLNSLLDSISSIKKNKAKYLKRLDNHESSTKFINLLEGIIALSKPIKFAISELSEKSEEFINCLAFEIYCYKR